MDDRKLLELAAKAAGVGGGWDWPRGAKAPTFWRDAKGIAWRPLTDDGDAFRLAVKLGLFGDTGMTFEFMEAGDCAATRRAIVRAAAASVQNH